MGVRLSVDDSEPGYSSLSYLKRLPVHEVKIDRRFVRHLNHDSDDQTIVRSIVDLGANLSLDVVAEGVEDQAGWEQLDRMGRRYAQGYLLSRPLPLPDFLPWLEQYHLHPAPWTQPPTRITDPPTSPSSPTADRARAAPRHRVLRKPPHYRCSADPPTSPARHHHPAATQADCRRGRDSAPAAARQHLAAPRRHPARALVRARLRLRRDCHAHGSRAGPTTRLAATVPAAAGRLAAR